MIGMPTKATPAPIASQRIGATPSTAQSQPPKFRSSPTVSGAVSREADCLINGLT
jgi:hypothetical protein